MMNGEWQSPEEDSYSDEPVSALKDLEEVASSSFLGDIRKKIQRRRTASQFLSFSWQMPKAVILELGNILVHVLNALSVHKEE